MSEFRKRSAGTGPPQNKIAPALWRGLGHKYFFFGMKRQRLPRIVHVRAENVRRQEARDQAMDWVRTPAAPTRAVASTEDDLDYTARHDPYFNYRPPVPDLLLRRQQGGMRRHG